MYLKHVVTDSKPCLQKADLPFVHAKGGIYVWLETPPGYDSEQFEQF